MYYRLCDQLGQGEPQHYLGSYLKLEYARAQQDSMARRSLDVNILCGEGTLAEVNVLMWRSKRQIRPQSKPSWSP